MAEMTLVIGSEARTDDNQISGYVKSVVVDRGSRTATHLVVEPEGREGLARLVPLDDHVAAREGKIRLGYTGAEFKNLPAAEETLAEVLSGPVDLVQDGWRPADDGLPVADGSKVSPVRAGFIGEMDLVPGLRPAEEEEHRGDRVHATDGEIGQLRAIGIDPGSHQVTHVHVRLHEGHLGRHKDVAIPSDNVSGFAAGIRLNISRQHVQDLAQEDIDQPTG